MGILTSYIEQGTKLKSLKFGDNDKFTSQPFIQTPIPSDDKVVTKPATPLAAYADGVVRGALISVQRSARDVERLTKYMATPSGVQFALKQNLLSRVAVGTETSGFFNEGIYTPLSTLAQAGVGILGIHLNKQGLDPTGLTKLSLKKYTSSIRDQFQSSNRLVALSTNKTTQVENLQLNPNYTTLLSYKGGPGSVLGIGSTKIKYATDNGGELPLRTVFNTKGPSKHILPDTTGSFLPVTGATTKYIQYTSSSFSFASISPSKTSHDFIVSDNQSYSVYKPGTLNGIDGLQGYLTPGRTGNRLSLYDNEKDRRQLAISAYTSSINYRLEHAGAGRQIVDKLTRPYTSGSFDVSPKINGYREYSSDVTINVDAASSKAKPEVKYVALNNQSGSYLANLNKNVGWYPDVNGNLIYDNLVFKLHHSIGPDFRLVNRNVRGFGDVNLLNKYYDTVTTSSDYYSANRATVDQIYYASNDKRTSTEFGANKDLITFRIAIIDPTDPSNSEPETLTFRAYIDNFSDSYNPDWNSQTYMGRGEKFYKYNSFDRKISLGFTVAAEGEHHRDKMYSHLNQLASSLAPTYTAKGYMVGNIHKLTVGNYVNSQYGIITGMTYDIIEESPWDIKSGRQLPMYIKVTGFQFIPIHNFRPEYKGKNSPNFIGQYEPSQTISLPPKKPTDSQITGTIEKPKIEKGKTAEF